jgi:ABC-type amino acid transport substrate-binding protein
MFRFALLVLFFLQSTSIQGKTLKLIALQDPTFFIGTAEKPEGFIVDLLEDLKEKLNAAASENEKISYEYSLEPNKTYGVKNADGTWNGLVGAVIAGRADIAVAPLTINKLRSEVVQFAHPFMSFSLIPLIKKPAPGQPTPFTNLKELKTKLEAGELTIGYVRGGSTERYIANHKSEFVRSLTNYSSTVDSVVAGIEKVRTDPKFVYYGEHTAVLSTVMNQPCDLQVSWHGMLGEGFYGFAFPSTDEGRRMADKFSHAIIAAQQDGTISTLFYRWWIQKATCPPTKHCTCAN